MAASAINIQFFHSTYGELVLGSFENRLCLCDWRYRKMRPVIDERITDGLNASFAERNSPVTDEAIQQLNAYFNNKRKTFDLPLLMVGSDFQKKIWKALLAIPYGKTLSYRQLSRHIGNEKAIRAVAAANGANALSIFVPCHRVIGSNGELTGYAGGLEVKKKLLELENARPFSDQMRLFD